MKSHDIGLLLKLASLEKSERSESPDSDSSGHLQYTTRSLEAATGISKSQINLALNRCINVGLAKKNRHSGVLKINRKALYEFLVHGLKYVFPARAGELTRGMATAFAAPVLEGKLMSAGDYRPVWPDAKGSDSGLRVEPLFRTAPYAARNDSELYRLLALVDAIRLGKARERNLAADLLKKELELQG